MPLRPCRLRPHTCAAAGLVLMLGLSAAGAWAQTPLPPAYDYDEPLPEAPRAPPPWQDLALGEAKHAYRMPVYANRKLSGNLHDIQRVIVMLHGARRDASRYYQDIETLVQRDPARRADTLILALEFPTPIDAAYAGRPAWRKASWETGAKSVQAAGRPAPISAFQVLDDVLRKLADRKRLPALTNIVLAGHSGGAQLLQRYAVLNDVDGAIRRNGLALRYVVANAASYLYLTNERPRRGGTGFEPYERGICPTYNQYPYGPQNLPRYSADSDAASLYVRYAARDVVYLLGSADNNPEDHGLDKRCGAEAQGATRLSRGLGYLRYDRLLASRGARPVALHHEHQQVMGVGHESAAMFGSLCGTRALLGDHATIASNAAACQPIDQK
ncbi:hypothetical protein [Bordetella sp. BOR01]|uniref:hypothetical protein n=1 Tax=Bordetella sp. BOR01 TaxID=2854779 RepID=UPI001C470470|nr:hypothetical protein [Bordetella sp. BOR01]MBV7486789.1 hypothetical protein [Bordetella sp. BOR01]